MKQEDVPQKLTIGRLREMYLRRETTPEAVVREIVRRAEEDRRMNIWITPPSEEAAAPYLAALRGTNPEDKPLWGIPFAIKDNIDLAGTPTTAGCPDFAYAPSEHAAVVRRLLDAGAIPVGKTNLDQFATGLAGMRSPYGETRNALREELISGGSSSGSAVAVARGHCAFALGTDTAGSGRVPAALNRLVGFKPSLGAWPVKGVVPACESLDCVSVLTHTPEDAFVVDGAARGAEPADPWSRTLPAPVDRLPGKVCLPDRPPAFFGPFAAEYRAAWEAAEERLKRMGLPVEYVGLSIFERAAAMLYDGPWIAERWAGVGKFVEAHPGSVHEVTERVLRSGSAAEYGAASLFRAMHELQELKRQTKELLADAVLALPTVGGTWTRRQLRDDPLGANAALGLYTNHCNLLDLCALALPADDAAHHLPFGITLFALAENESLLRGAGRLFAGPGREEPVGEQAEDRAKPPSTLIAVCGLHMRGFPLERQLTECGAAFVREAVTAPKYRMVKLPTAPPKPGLIKCAEGGGRIRLELWEMPLAGLGRFAAAIPAPLGLGKVELEDGSEVTGFVCEAYAASGAEDITVYGGWRQAQQ